MLVTYNNGKHINSNSHPILPTTKLILTVKTIKKIGRAHKTRTNLTLFRQLGLLPHYFDNFTGAANATLIDVLT
jgi:hypothetical protein